VGCPYKPPPHADADANSYAEMDKDEKNKISHRFRALEKLKKWLEEKTPES
jgi:inosine triphosphate pyrophosphatase